MSRLPKSTTRFLMKRLILPEVDKYNQMKEEIRGSQKQGSGLSEAEKNELIRKEREEAMATARN